ncbi:MAG: hypothetical protein M0R06_22550 [Sphaerochaeta sp.]|jgi:hypothetical protein|nr:hypothetical protein [Sphaerochaeta sp.]
MELTARIKKCLQRHPEWENRRVAKSTGATFGEIEAVRRGTSPAPPRSDSPIAPPVPGPAAISLARVKERFDIAAAITRALSTVKRGTLLPEEELCRMTAGRDRNRFRRAVDNHPDLARAHRVKLRLDDATDGKYYWGHSEDIQEALRLRDM